MQVFALPGTNRIANIVGAGQSLEEIAAYDGRLTTGRRVVSEEVSG